MLKRISVKVASLHFITVYEYLTVSEAHRKTLGIIPHIKFLSTRTTNLENAWVSCIIFDEMKKKDNWNDFLNIIYLFKEK